MQKQIPRLFDEIEIGDEIGPVIRVPTTAMVRCYIEVNELHELSFFLDPERAHAAGFEKPIVPGHLNVSFLTQMLKDHFIGWQLRTLHTTFRTPALHGESLTLWGMVTEKTEQDGVPTIHCDVIAENPRGDRVIVGTATLSWRGAPA
jgi:acyl dehydratase